MASRALHCLTYLFLIVPPLLLTVYLLAAFPSPPASLVIHSSLSSLPKHCKSWEIYPEDYYPGGSYVELPYGRVRYWLTGPAKGQKVRRSCIGRLTGQTVDCSRLLQIVLIHGLSVPSIIWKDIAPELAARGYRVLLYGARHNIPLDISLTGTDLYGRGYSDAPYTTYDARLYSTQLALLMQHVDWDKAVVVGVSMARLLAISKYRLLMSL